MPTLIRLSFVTASALALTACGYAGQSDTHDAGQDIVTETEPAERPTNSQSPGAGKPEADDPTSEEGTGTLADPPWAGEEETEQDTGGDTDPSR